MHEINNYNNINLININKDWLVGFTDGEGCFFIGVNKSEQMTVKFQVLPEFRLVQHRVDVDLLFSIQKFFGCGIVVSNKGNKSNDILEYRVRGLSNFSNIIIPFFDKNPLLSKKKYDFECFKQVIKLMENGEHLTQNGLVKIIDFGAFGAGRASGQK